MILLAAAALGPRPAPSAAPTDSKEKGPLEMNEMGLEGDLKKIEQQWAEIEKHLASEARFATRAPAVSRWSVGQQVGHIALSIDKIAGMIDEVMAHPQMNAEKPMSVPAGQVLKGGQIPRGVGKAPPEITFPFQPRLGLVKDDLAKAREHWKKSTARAEELGKTPGKFPHFALGPMTSAEWVRFTAVHNAHHLKIINDIVAKAGEAPAKVDTPGPAAK